MFWFRHAYRLGPGVHWYWPPVMRPMVHPVKRDTLNLAPQSLPFSGELPVGITISVTVVYTITDIMKALVDTFDFTATIRDRAQAGVIRSVIGKSVDELVRRHQRVNNAITKRIRTDLEPFGVHVEVAFMSDFHLTSMHRVIGSTTILPVADVAADPEEE